MLKMFICEDCGAQYIDTLAMGDICGNDWFALIERAKKHLLDSTNIESSPDEMKVLDCFLFRCWQMGWLESEREKKE